MADFSWAQHQIDVISFFVLYLHIVDKTVLLHECSQDMQWHPVDLCAISQYEHTVFSLIDKFRGLVNNERFFSLQVLVDFLMRLLR